MENCSCEISYWEFAIGLDDDPGILLSKSLMVNLICLTFGGSQDQLVIKISAVRWRNQVNVIVLTKSEEAEKNLLKNLSLNKLLDEFAGLINGQQQCEICVKSIQLCHTGYLTHGTKQEFENVQCEAQLILGSLDDQRRHHEILFSYTDAIIADNRIFKAPLTPEDIRQLTNGILLRPYGQRNEASSSAESASKYCSVRNFVSSWHAEHQGDFLPDKMDADAMASYSKWPTSSCTSSISSINETLADGDKNISDGAESEMDNEEDVSGGDLEIPPAPISNTTVENQDNATTDMPDETAIHATAE